MSDKKDTKKDYNMIEILSIFEEIRDMFKALPKEYPAPLKELTVKGSVSVDNPQTEVKIINTQELTEKLEKLILAVKANKPVQGVKVLNQKEFPKTIKVAELEKYLEIMKKIAEREPEIIVKENKVEFPRRFQDAIPVVLVDANRQGFYNALASIVFPKRTVKPFSDYLLYASIEGDGGYTYVAKESREGKWVIQRKDETTGIWGVAVGKQNVETAWTGRASLPYNKMSNII